MYIHGSGSTNFGVWTLPFNYFGPFFGLDMADRELCLKFDIFLREIGKFFIQIIYIFYFIFKNNLGFNFFVNLFIFQKKKRLKRCGDIR